MKGKIRILQQHVSFSADIDNPSNYLLLIETNDHIPQRTYFVELKNFIFYDETMPFYVINQN